MAPIAMCRPRFFFASLVSLACLAGLPVQAAPGELDASYGTGGLAPIRIGQADDEVYAIAIQPDGKIVSVGSGGGFTALTRHLPDGTLDPAFGTSGRAVLGYWKESGSARGVVIQLDGKIVIAGLCPPHFFTVCVRRLLPDGSSDPSFAQASFDGPSSSPSIGFTAQADGKLLLAYRDLNSIGRIARLTIDGALDGTFGNAGIVNLGQGQYAYAVAVQPDGKVVVLQGASTVRLLPNGTFDSSFGIGGIASEGKGDAIALQPDGKIVLAGQMVANKATVRRLLSNGELDPSFSNDGSATVDYPGERGSWADAVAIQADGNIVLGGGSLGPANEQFVTVFRVDASGAPDTSFGSMGAVRLTPNSLPAFTRTSARGIAITGGGEIYAGAHADGDFQLFRLAAAGVPDPAFAGDGGTSTDLGSGVLSGDPVALLRMDDGRFVAVATPGVTRITPDGAADPTFGESGTINFPRQEQPYYGGAYRKPALQPDGKLIYSSQQALSGSVRYMYRLNADGSKDTGFSPNAIGGESIGLLPDGRILTVDVNPYSYVSKLARMLPGGTPDSTFWTAGVKSLEPLAITTLARETSGIWALGGTTDAGRKFAAARISEDGIYESTWGQNGRFFAPVLPNQPARIEVIRTLAAPGGKTILVGMGTWETLNSSGGCRVPFGSVKTVYKSTLIIIGIDAKGMLDTSFGTAGYVMTPLGGFETVITDAGVDAEGRILVSGMWQPPSAGGVRNCTHRAFVARFTPRGSYDSGFGVGGVAFLPYPMGGAVVGGLAALPDGSWAGLARVDHPVRPLVTFRLQGGGAMLAPGPVGDADGDGIPDGSEVGLSRDPYAKDNDVFGDARLFAMQQYRDFLEREGDQGGIDYWTGQLNAGAYTRANLVEYFLLSPEFSDRISPVVRLYFAYFLRIPDYDGLRFWIQTYAGGQTMEYVSEYFAGSPEFVARYGMLTNSQFVDLVYQNVLGRAPDASGRAYWTAELDSGRRNRGQVMLAFSESPEYRSLITNEVLVTMVYAGMLRRAPDPGGFSQWVSYLDSGNATSALVGNFIASAEYRTRFLP